ncbi:hypothetical protein ZWY2020_039806 [Hordeum vulgare]|nr:hypothetical protein ZWY2020_039806 [Hordeum vulgare]
MEYEAGLVVSGPMTQLEAEIWIQNMENHFGSNLISRKYEVEHALQYFTKSAAIWWKMHHAIQGFSGAESWEEFKKTLLRSRLIQKSYDNPKEKTCACKICGEIGHNQEEHKDGCTHCEENHPAEECPSSQKRIKTRIFFFKGNRRPGRTFVVGRIPWNPGSRSLGLTAAFHQLLHSAWPTVDPPLPPVVSLLSFLNSHPDSSQNPPTAGIPSAPAPSFRSPLPGYKSPHPCPPPPAPTAEPPPRASLASGSSTCPHR